MSAEADECTVDYFSVAAISCAKPAEIDQTINGRRRQHEPLDYHRTAPPLVMQALALNI